MHLALTCVKISFIMSALILVYLIWLVAGFVTWITAFGGNLLAIPIVFCLAPAHEDILQGYMAGAAMALFLTAIYFRHILWKEILLFTGASFAGVPPGLRYFINLPVKYLFLMAGLGNLLSVPVAASVNAHLFRMLMLAIIAFSTCMLLCRFITSA